jgi:hypothetical protein
MYDAEASRAGTSAFVYLAACGACEYSRLRNVANPEHVAALRADIDEWNEWRSENPDVRPDLLEADLKDANLVLADLSRAVLRNADLTMANLKGADLRHADMRGANLVGARLIGTDFQGADLRGADLRTAEDLTAEQLEETIGDEATKLPDETPRPPRWRTELGAR